MNSNDTIDQNTGEIVVREQYDQVAVFNGIAAERSTDLEEQILRAPPSDEQLDILPSGEVFLPQVHYRGILNDSFGPLGWALRPMSPVVVQDNLMCREFALVIRGRFAACAIGECNYDSKNSRMSYATAAEALKSNAMMRCCKDLGVAACCWDRTFCEDFKRRCCEQVRSERNGRMEWRKKRVK